MLNFLKPTLLYTIRAVTLLIAVSLAAFVLVKLSPIDPVQAYIGADASVSTEQREKIAERWGVNEPPIKQYLTWFVSLCKGDFGVSLIFRQPVIKVIGERAMASIALMGASWLFAGALGFFLGVLAGAYRGRLLDKAIKTYCLTLSSAPVFWVGLLLMIIFSVNLKMFPLGLAAGAGKLYTEVTLAEKIKHLVLPVVTLSITGIPTIAMHTRQKLVEVLESDFIVYAVARGEKKWGIINRHCLRNIALPALTLQFTSFAELFGGSVLAEQVFSYPGLGSTAVLAGLRNDVPLLLGVTLFSALFVFFGNTIANFLYYAINPLIRRNAHA